MLSVNQAASLIGAFAQARNLGERFERDALAWLLPLSSYLTRRRATAGRPILVGLNGCQGSGKSTASALLVELIRRNTNLSALTISIDDFYLSSDERQVLAADVHPLLSTRGVPGTHSLKLIQSTIGSLLKDSGSVWVPSFDKSTDNPRPVSVWQKFNAPCDILILEGWCVGVTPQQANELCDAINLLEATEDPSGIWRNWVNEKLKEYQSTFALIDCLVMLQAPSFNHVVDWRYQQEQQLATSLARTSDATGVMDRPAIERFVQYFQRITEHSLRTTGCRADVLIKLNAAREMVSCTPDIRAAKD